MEEEMILSEEPKSKRLFSRTNLMGVIQPISAHFRLDLQNWTVLFCKKTQNNRQKKRFSFHQPSHWYFPLSISLQLCPLVSLFLVLFFSVYSLSTVCLQNDLFFKWEFCYSIYAVISSVTQISSQVTNKKYICMSWQCSVWPDTVQMELVVYICCFLALTC